MLDQIDAARAVWREPDSDEVTEIPFERRREGGPRPGAPAVRRREHAVRNGRDDCGVRIHGRGCDGAAVPFPGEIGLRAGELHAETLVRVRMAGALSAIHDHGVQRGDHQPASSIDGEIVDGSATVGVSDGGEGIGAVVGTVRSAVGAHVDMCPVVARRSHSHDKHAGRADLVCGRRHMRERGAKIARAVEPRRSVREDR